MRDDCTTQNLDIEGGKSTVDAIAEASLPRWGIGAGTGIKLISHSENAVYLITRPDGWKKILRVHRAGYHSLDGVRTELAWMKALQDEAGVETPQALPGLDGDLIQIVASDAEPEGRMVVLFDFITGAEPRPDDVVQAFRHLGAIAARMHDHARSWTRPAFFERLAWDYEHALGTKPNWGAWEDGFILHRPGKDIVERADALMRSRLEMFGMGPERYGLIHSDLRLANLLIDGGEIKVLDFDDCGLGWFLYDVASAVTFLENHPQVDSMVAAWVSGYRSIGELSEAEVAEIPTFMMLRRLIIMGWAGSHPDTDLAREMGDEYTGGTVEFARKYLALFGH